MQKERDSKLTSDRAVELKRYFSALNIQTGVEGGHEGQGEVDNAPITED
jgi:hypothetical protein